VFFFGRFPPKKNTPLLGTRRGEGFLPANPKEWTLIGESIAKLSL
jgi:hypothetical protein